MPWHTPWSGDRWSLVTSGHRRLTSHQVRLVRLFKITGPRFNDRGPPQLLAGLWPSQVGLASARPGSAEPGSCNTPLLAAQCSQQGSFLHAQGQVIWPFPFLFHTGPASAGPALCLPHRASLCWSCPFFSHTGPASAGSVDSLPHRASIFWLC